MISERTRQRRHMENAALERQEEQRRAERLHAQREAAAAAIAAGAAPCSTPGCWGAAYPASQRGHCLRCVAAALL